MSFLVDLGPPTPPPESSFMSDDVYDFYVGWVTRHLPINSKTSFLGAKYSSVLGSRSLWNSEKFIFLWDPSPRTFFWGFGYLICGLVVRNTSTITPFPHPAPAYKTLPWWAQLCPPPSRCGRVRTVSRRSPSKLVAIIIWPFSNTWVPEISWWVILVPHVPLWLVFLLVTLSWSSCHWICWLA